MGMSEVSILLGLLVLMGLLLLAAAAVVVIAWYSARKKGAMGAPAAPEGPLDTLRRRYARGEITREEYLQMRQDLTD